MAKAPPQRRTWITRTVWILSFVAAVALIGLLVLWVLPSLLTRHPSTGLTAAQRLSATNAVRATLVTFAVAVGAAGTLFFTGRTFLLSRETQVTERYTRAVTQIGDDKLEVRIGGIYALERIGRDSAADCRTVVYVLGALVRHRSNDGRAVDEEPSDEVYTALRVISRLAPMTDVTVNLRGANLRKANLHMLRNISVHIEGADLAGAKVPEGWEVTHSTDHPGPTGSPPAV
jgi:hypothetical protein